MIKNTIVTSALSLYLFLAGLLGIPVQQDIQVGASVLREFQGGTGTGTYNTGDTLYSPAANTLSKRTIGSAGQVYTVVGGVPDWADPTGSGVNDWHVVNNALTPSTTIDVVLPSNLTVSNKATTTDLYFDNTFMDWLLTVGKGGTASGKILFQGLESNTSTILGITSKDADRTDQVNLAIVGYGNAIDFENRENLDVAWSPNSMAYEIATSKSGNGLYRPIQIYTGGNGGQIYLDTSGDTRIPNLFSTTTYADTLCLTDGCRTTWPTSGSGTNDWMFAWPGAITPTTSVGLFVNASSTVDSTLRVNNTLTLNPPDNANAILINASSTGGMFQSDALRINTYGYNKSGIYVDYQGGDAGGGTGFFINAVNGGAGEFNTDFAGDYSLKVQNTNDTGNGLYVTAKNIVASFATADGIGIVVSGKPAIDATGDVLITGNSTTTGSVNIGNYQPFWADYALTVGGGGAFQNDLYAGGSLSIGADATITDQLWVEGESHLATTSMSFGSKIGNDNNYLEVSNFNSPFGEAPILKYHSLGANAPVGLTDGIFIIKEAEPNALIDYDGEPQLIFFSNDLSRQLGFKYSTTTDELEIAGDKTHPKVKIQGDLQVADWEQISHIYLETDEMSPINLNVTTTTNTLNFENASSYKYNFGNDTDSLEIKQFDLGGGTYLPQIICNTPGFESPHTCVFSDGLIVYNTDPNETAVLMLTGVGATDSVNIRHATTSNEMLFTNGSVYAFDNRVRIGYNYQQVNNNYLDIFNRTITGIGDIPSFRPRSLGVDASFWETQGGILITESSSSPSLSYNGFPQIEFAPNDYAHGAIIDYNTTTKKLNFFGWNGYNTTTFDTDIEIKNNKGIELGGVWRNSWPTGGSGVNDWKVVSQVFPLQSYLTPSSSINVFLPNKLGVGTENPEGNFDVYDDDSSTEFRVTNGSANGHIWAFNSLGTQSLDQPFLQGGFAIQDVTAGYVRQFINKQGNTGFGTYVPGAKVDINVNPISETYLNEPNLRLSKSNDIESTSTAYTDFYISDEGDLIVESSDNNVTINDNLTVVGTTTQATTTMAWGTGEKIDFSVIDLGGSSMPKIQFTSPNFEANGWGMLSDRLLVYNNDDSAQAQILLASVDGQDSVNMRLNTTTGGLYFTNGKQYMFEASSTARMFIEPFDLYGMTPTTPVPMIRFQASGFPFGEMYGGIADALIIAQSPKGTKIGDSSNPQLIFMPNTFSGDQVPNLTYNTTSDEFVVNGAGRWRFDGLPFVVNNTSTAVSMISGKLQVGKELFSSPISFSNYSFYSYATTNNYAGYFDGNVYISGNATTTGDFTIGNVTNCADLQTDATGKVFCNFAGISEKTEVSKTTKEVIAEIRSMSFIEKIKLLFF